jgi:hypothetical protein
MACDIYLLFSYNGTATPRIFPTQFTSNLSSSFKAVKLTSYKYPSGEQLPITKDPVSQSYKVIRRTDVFGQEFGK